MAQDSRPYDLVTEYRLDQSSRIRVETARLAVSRVTSGATLHLRPTCGLHQFIWLHVNKNFEPGLHVGRHLQLPLLAIGGRQFRDHISR